MQEGAMDNKAEHDEIRRYKKADLSYERNLIWKVIAERSLMKSKAWVN